MRFLTSWWSLNKEAFLILKRDRVFVPVVIAGLVITFFANAASGWTLEEFEKVLFDIGLAGFRVTGGVLAMLWGIRSVTEPLQDRSIELRIASPLARFTWILSRFSGLAICLTFVALIFAAMWQTTMFLNRFGLMNNLQNWALGMLLAEWLVLGSLGILLGTVSRFSTAMFACFGLWIMGLMSPLVAATMAPDMDPTQRKIIDWLATTWNFQRFNLIDQLDAGLHTVNINDLVPRLSWSASVLAGCIILACWIFQEKDLT